MKDNIDLLVGARQLGKTSSAMERRTLVRRCPGPAGGSGCGKPISAGRASCLEHSRGQLADAAPTGAPVAPPPVAPAQPAGDQRYVYSATCTWHGPIQEVSHTKPGKVRFKLGNPPVEQEIDSLPLPCCPHCGSVLMEYPDRAHWDSQIEAFMAKHPELPLYREWIETLHGPCRPLKEWDWRAAYAEYAAGRVQ